MFPKKEKTFLSTIWSYFMENGSTVTWRLKVNPPPQKKRTVSVGVYFNWESKDLVTHKVPKMLSLM